MSIENDFSPELVEVVRRFISLNKDALIDQWVHSRANLDSEIYADLPKNDVVIGSAFFLQTIVDIMSERDQEKIGTILERFLKDVITQRILQGVNIEDLLKAAILHREQIIENFRRSKEYNDLPESKRLNILLLLLRTFEIVNNSIAKMAHEAAVSEIDRLKSFNENIVNSVSEGIIIEDENGLITYANPKYLNLLRVKKEDILGIHWEETVPRDQLKKFKEEANKRNLGIDGKYEGTLLTSDGVRLPVLISARSLHEGGRFRGVLSVITDIKEMKRMQTDLSESKRELERLNMELEKYSKELEEDNIRLRATMNIEPVKEKPLEGKKIYSLEPGYLFLMLTQEADFAFRVFADIVKHGQSGLCITRTVPDNIRLRYNLEKTPIIWLTSNKIADFHCISPANIVDLSSAIITFLEKSDDGIIILEGLEYLISQNNFRSILNLVQLLNDKIMLCNSRMILLLDPKVVDFKDLHLLKKEVRLYETEDPNKDPHMLALR